MRSQCTDIWILNQELFDQDACGFPLGCQLQRQSVFLLNVDIAMVKWESDGKGSCCLVSLWGLHVVLCGVHRVHLDRRSQTSQIYTRLSLGTSGAWIATEIHRYFWFFICHLSSVCIMRHFLFSFANSWEKWSALGNHRRVFEMSAVALCLHSCVNIQAEVQFA